MSREIHYGSEAEAANQDAMSAAEQAFANPLPITKFMGPDANEPPTIDCVLPGLAAGTVGMVVAPGGTGKSFWALQTALDIASCALGHGFNANGKTGKVVFLSKEDQPTEIYQRCHAIGSKFSEGQTMSVHENFRAIDLRGKDLPITSEQSRSIIIKYCRGSRLIILDTLRRFHSLEENDNGAMTTVIDSMEKIAIGTGAAVIAMHHCPKPSKEREQTWRGASALGDNSRYVGSMSVLSEAEAKEHRLNYPAWRYVRYSLVKWNGKLPPDAWFFRGDDGVLRPVESPIGSGFESSSASVNKGTKQLSKHKEVAKEVEGVGNEW